MLKCLPANLWNVSLTRLAVWGRALSLKRMISSDSIPERFDFMARRSTLSHQEMNHASLLFFACFHFQCWTNTFYTMLTSRAIKKSCENLWIFTMLVSYPTYDCMDSKQQCSLLLRDKCFMVGVRFSFDCPLTYSSILISLGTVYYSHLSILGYLPLITLGNDDTHL